MFKHFLTALTVLSLLPTAAQAVAVNSSTEALKTKTYTGFARDTSFSMLLDANGASSCSVSGTFAGGNAVLVIPRPNATTPASDHVGSASAFNAATPTGTFTPGAAGFSIQWLSANQSSVQITCSPTTGGGGGGASDAASLTYDNSTSGMVATNAQAAIDELDAGKLDTADALNVLVSGQDGIATADDPNVGSVTCPTAAAGSCLFIGANGSGWSNSDTTTWRGLGTKMQFAMGHLESLTAIRESEMDGTNCFPRFDNEVRVANCTGSADQTGLVAMQDMVITDIYLSVTRTTISLPSTVNSCAYCISTDEGLTCETGAKVSMPPADGTNLTFHTVAHVQPNLSLNAGDFYQLVALEGEFSGAGGTGTCGSGQFSYNWQIEGYYR